jgi:hypothetical protein
MNDNSNLGYMASRLERLEELASSTVAASWRGLSTQRLGDVAGQAAPPEGTALGRRTNQAGISPWLFVMATALNTTVASLLAVIITLGVVRQEQTGGSSRDGTPAAAAHPTVTTGFAGNSIDVRPIGSPDQPLRLEARKPARLPLQIQPDDAARESFILVLSGVPAGTTLSGAARVGSDTWLLPPAGEQARDHRAGMVNVALRARR